MDQSTLYETALTLPWLLVATPQLVDPMFKRRVVLIVEHGKAGSMGFVLNQKAPAPLSELVSVNYVSIPNYITAWFGGPVERQSGVILSHNVFSDSSSNLSSLALENLRSNRNVQQTGSHIQSGYALSSTEETLIELVAHFEEIRLGTQPTNGTKDLYPYRFLIGYAGWGRGQLEREIRGGAWIQAPASPKLVFNTHWQQLWQECMSQVGINPRSFAPSYQEFLN